MRNAKVLFSLSTAAIAGALAGFAFSGQSQAAKPPTTAETYRQLDLFGDVFERVRRDYVEPTNDKELVQSAINGMLSSLDPHSSYMNPDAFKDMQVQTKGEFGGVGIEVTMENGVVKVVSPMDETPAAKAGVKSGDFVTHIDDQPVLGLTLNEAVDKMRGPVNTKIKLTVAREGLNEPFDLTLTREKIRLESVRARAEGDVGYIRVTTFNEQSEGGVEKAIRDLKKEIGPNLKGYVLDLRNNPGGLLDQAIGISDVFLDKGEIVSTRGRNPDDTQRYNSHAGDLTGGKPVVVLINGGSASASEIVAGALQDHKRATVVGGKSFGKGSVQTIIPLGANGAIRLTTARYYTPAGISIQAKGITPDVAVDNARTSRRQITEAQLPNHLRGENEGQGAAAPANSEAPKPEAKADGPPDTTDYQLKKALEILRGATVAAQAKAN